LRRKGLGEIELEPADEALETEDLLEMVSAGLLAITVADDYLAEFWSQVYDKLTLHPELKVRSGGRIAWAFRKNSPQLATVVNDFVRGHKKGTLMGNILLKRYWQSTRWVANPLMDGDLDRFEEMASYFRKYAEQYGLDWIMVAAQGYQESGLDQSRRSRAGAVGVMQLLPSTARDKNVNIPDVENLESNIHAGVKYLRFILDRYFAGTDLTVLDQHLFAFAAYNAGPARVAGLRRLAEQKGLDPDVWFRNVEVVAAQEIGRETVQYVSNIYKYYLAYRRVAERIQERARARGSMP
jgi:membrane-bound lytic murein transglycosylase MltF